MLKNMKKTKFFAALVLGFAVVACAPKAEEQVAEENAEAVPVEKTIKDYQSTKAEIDTVSYLVGVNFGSFIKNYNFGDLNYAQVRKGIDAFLVAKGNPRSAEFGEQFKVDPNRMNEIFNTYLEKRRQLTLLENKEKEEKFLSANALKDGVQTTPSGLQYKIISEGNEVKPAAVDTVWARYRGTLIDGTVFDESDPEGDAVKFVLNRVIKGWTEGLQLIGEGGEIELYIPSALGYGQNGTQGIAPNSALIFNVSLEKVGKYTAPVEAK